MNHRYAIDIYIHMKSIHEVIGLETRSTYGHAGNLASDSRYEAIANSEILPVRRQYTRLNNTDTHACMQAVIYIHTVHREVHT